MTVEIVTDGVSDVSRDTARRLGVTVVRWNVHFGTRTFEHNVSIHIFSKFSG